MDRADKIVAEASPLPALMEAAGEDSEETEAAEDSEETEAVEDSEETEAAEDSEETEAVEDLEVVVVEAVAEEEEAADFRNATLGSHIKVCKRTVILFAIEPNKCRTMNLCHLSFFARVHLQTTRGQILTSPLGAAKLDPHG
jgi:DNA polymerase II large subunit